MADMDALSPLWPAVILFFCLWAALLARLKGYSAFCWVFAAGPIAVILLWRLPPVSPLEGKARRWRNRLGLVLSAVSLLVGGLSGGCL